MSGSAEKAVANHIYHLTCSQSVLEAFHEEAGVSGENALIIAQPMSGGKMVTCGALLAAEYVLRKAFPESGDERAAELRRRFTSMNHSSVCRELKGGLTGKPLRSCRGCVIDAAQLLEEMLQEDNNE